MSRAPSATRPGRAGGASGSYDAIVIGAGHNGLTAAAYLAKAGLRVLVLEARDRLGGATDTTHLDGVRIPAVAHTVGRLAPAVVRDLDLRAHGLHLVTPVVRAWAPQPDGRGVALFDDPAATAQALRSWSTADAAAFLDFDRRVRALSAFLAELADETPPDIAGPGFADARLGLRLGRAFRGLGRTDGRTILRVLPMAVADFVAEAFASEPVRAAVAWRGVRHAALGPWSAGSTFVLLQDAAGNDGGAAGETVFAKGGPGAVVDALAAAVRARGGEIRTAARVERVASTDGRATGVVLASGEEINAAAIVGAIDPKQLLASLVDPVAIGPTMRWRASNLRTPGVSTKVNLVLDALPAFTAGGDDERLLRGRILIGATSIDDMERAFDATKYGRLPERPVLEVTIPSLADPALVDGAPTGTHVASAIVQWTPATLRDADWEACRETIGDLALAMLDEVAPGTSARVRARQVLTPVDLEREYGLTGGHPMHVEPALDSFFLWRPLLGWSRYRMPVEGLYLAGSGAHPGGGVTGLPGRNAAREVVADAKRRR